MDGELSNDERSNSTEDNFVSEVYNITLDKTIMMIDKRYSNADHILKNLTFFLLTNLVRNTLKIFLKR